MNYYQNNSQVRFNSNKIPFDQKRVKLNLTVMNESFGQWLKSQRKLRGFNQPELAKLAHTTKATISLLEGDKIAQPRFDSIDNIAKALNIPIVVVRQKLTEWQTDGLPKNGAKIPEPVLNAYAKAGYLEPNDNETIAMIIKNLNEQREREAKEKE